jgi:hypothetical protein
VFTAVQAPLQRRVSHAGRQCTDRPANRAWSPTLSLTRAAHGPHSPQGLDRAPRHRRAPPKGPFKGVSWDPTTSVYRLKVAIPSMLKDKPPPIRLATYPNLEAAEEGARAHDSIAILLYGHFAATNFPYATYTLAHVSAAAEQLRGAGCDVRAAIEVAQGRRGACMWGRVHPGACPQEWVAAVTWDRTTPNKRTERVMVKLDFGAVLQDPDAAARFADAAMLVMEGPRKDRLLNFPVASYSDGDIRAAHQALLAWVGGEPFSGAYKEHEATLLAQFEANIEALSEVKPPGCTPPHPMPARASSSHRLARTSNAHALCFQSPRPLNLRTHSDASGAAWSTADSGGGAAGPLQCVCTPWQIRFG